MSGSLQRRCGVSPAHWGDEPEYANLTGAKDQHMQNSLERGIGIVLADWREEPQHPKSHWWKETDIGHGVGTIKLNIVCVVY